MRCAWDSLLKILPARFRTEVDKLGKQQLQELRLRINAPPELVLGKTVLWLQHSVTKNDIDFCINMASQYSPWAAATMTQGFLTAPGGHRIGLCGDAAVSEGKLLSLRQIRSLNIRVARDIPGIGRQDAAALGSILCIGPPGSGKTTLLRDLARQISRTETVAVLDERGELFPAGFPLGKRMDVLTLCPKAAGIEMLLRSMGPSYIAMDEITGHEDASALLHTVGCGVQLLATAHAYSVQDLRKRLVYRPLIEQEIFQTVFVLSRDQHYRMERMVA